MDSPYRTAELDVLLTASGGDCRCANAPPVCRPHPSRFARGTHACRAALTVLMIAGDIVGITACLLVCAMLVRAELPSRTEYEPSPKLSVAAPAPPPLLPAAAPLPSAPARERPLCPAGLLAESEPVTHDPVVLRSRARDLVRAGVLARVDDVTLALASTPEATAFQFFARPPPLGVGPGGIIVGEFAAGSLLARAGLHAGDLVLSVDGYAAGGTEWIDHSFRSLDRGGLVAVELVRGGQRRVLAITWPTAPAR